jgi:hypothetical protein
MVCKRCGKVLPDSATVCSACGTVNGSAWENAQSATGYGQYWQESTDAPHSYQQSSSASSSYRPGYMPPPPGPGYASSYQAIPIFSSQQGTMHVSDKNSNALIAEIILSLFGVFGVGWLMAGETVTGVILLVCSFIVYWPIMIVGTILTFGLGLICLGPIAIGAIILNILLLNSVLNRKATRFVVVPPSPYAAPHASSARQRTDL